MKVRTAACFAAFPIALALPIAASAQSTASGASAASNTPTVKLNAGSGNLVISFSEIDRNQDGMISVQEWNDFVRTVGQREGSASSGGATGKAADPKPASKRP